MTKIKHRDFYVMIKKDEDGYYVGEVPQLRACYSQGETIDELLINIKEVIELCLESENEENFSVFSSNTGIVLHLAEYFAFDLINKGFI